MVAKKLFIFLGLAIALTSLVPAADAQVGFGIGFGGGRRGGGFSFGVGRPYGYWGGYGYRPWGYGGLGYRPWYRDYDDYYYPRTRYVTRETTPVEVEYVTKAAAPAQQGLDRKGRNYWRINNKTDMNILVASDADTREFDRDDINKKLFREDDYTIKIQAGNKDTTFTKVLDHNVDLIIDNGEIVLETWNE